MKQLTRTQIKFLVEKIYNEIKDRVEEKALYKVELFKKSKEYLVINNKREKLDQQMDVLEKQKAIQLDNLTALAKKAGFETNYCGEISTTLPTDQKWVGNNKWISSLEKEIESKLVLSSIDADNLEDLIKNIKKDILNG